MGGDRRVALDTSVIVAALLSVHERHPAALPFVAALRGTGQLVVPAPALIEAYSVLTRLPTPLRLERRVVAEALFRTFHDAGETVALDGPAAWELVAGAVASEVVGGAVYDFHIAACARRAGATELATFNRRHFERFDVPGLRIIEPSVAGG